MTIGKSNLWLKSIKDIDKELMKCVEKIWPIVISKVSPMDLEDKISQRLVDVLRKERDVWSLGFLDIQFKLREEDQKGDFTTKGIIDIVLFLDNSYQKYIAYEAKRLNTVDSNGQRIGSQAGKYIEEGVVRYVTAQYAEKLPYGCMIGYVMDGDCQFASQKIIAGLNDTKRKQFVRMEPIAIDVMVGACTWFETTHKRSGTENYILVRHKLFSLH